MALNMKALDVRILKHLEGAPASSDIDWLAFATTAADDLGGKYDIDTIRSRGAQIASMDPETRAELKARIQPEVR